MLTLKHKKFDTFWPNPRISTNLDLKTQNFDEFSQKINFFTVKKCLSSRAIICLPKSSQIITLITQKV